MDSGNEMIRFIKKYYPEKISIINKIFRDNIEDDDKNIQIFTKNKNEIENNLQLEFRLLLKSIYKFFGYFYELNNEEFNELMESFNNSIN